MVDPLGDATWNRLLRSTGSVLACIASNAGAVVDVLVERLPASIWNRWKGTIIDVGALARRAGVIGAITQATWNAGEFLAAMATDPSVYRVTIFLTPPPRRQLVLQMGGTVGDLGLYPSAEVATEHLREVLGPPTAERTGAFCDQGGGPGRVLEWDNFTVYLIDDASSLSPDVPGLEVSGPAMVGWSVSDWAPRRSGLRTAAGIGWGSTVAQVQQAYPGEEVQDRGIEWAFDIFRGDLSNLWITVGGPDPDERVVAMTSGFACPE
jgi:hypothetical protein